jgi:hypothetical protein
VPGADVPAHGPAAGTMRPGQQVMEHRKFGRQVALDELFDLTLFQKLHALEAGEVRGVLSRLITTEARHVAFWQALFGLQAARLDVSRRVKLALCMVLRRLFGSGMTYLLKFCPN